MKKLMNVGGLLVVLLCCAVIVFAGCDTGSSSDPTDPVDPNNPVDPAAPADPADPPAAPRLDLESANIATLKTDGAFIPDTGDVRATWGDAASFGTAVSDMDFSADTTVADSGDASLKVTATVLQNHYSADVAQWVFRTDLDKAGLGSPVDLTGKTVSIRALVPAAGNLGAVKLVFWDSNWKQSQGTGITIDSKDTWTTVSYKIGDPSDHADADFDITSVTLVSVVALKNGATAASSETLYIDSLNW